MQASAIQPLPSLAPSRPAGSATASPVAEPKHDAGRSSPGPNPALRIDPQLGIVVLEFSDAQGKTVSSLPTERVLAEYRRTGHAAGSEAPAQGTEKTLPAAV